ncbi:DUF432 domain-containing protein [Maribellus sediminis]|uniref:DUF432 domain-containing protein n=1 Tax=Maribellus sediminis TaxID=2696285 RepID=UPI00142F61B7|nr:DUF432 domain-containing protein [Maribellus sediminis]
MEKNSLFRKWSIQPGEAELIPCNTFVLGVRREKEGWFIKVFDDVSNPEEVNKDDIREGEYYHSGKSNSLIIAPALQYKPLVFKGNKMVIAPHQRMTFFVRIPLVLQLYFSKIQEDNLLKEIPSRRLSDTWFGEPDNGVAAFSLGNEYHLNFDSKDFTELEAVCPVTIFNNWDQQLEVQRLIIKADNMSLFRNDLKLVTSVVKLEYRGQDNISSVSYGTSKQYHGDNPNVLAKARNDDTKSLLKANFHFIRNIYNRTE